MKKCITIVILLIILTIIGGGVFMVFFKDNDSKDKPEKVDVVNKEDPFITSLKDEQYYIDENLDRYIAYGKDKDMSAGQIVTDVNCNLDKKMYEDTVATDISLDKLMLVNKFYYLTEDYTPSDLVTLNSKYNSGYNSKLRKEAADAFMEMSDAAMLDNVIIKNASGYRSYNYQVNLYNKYVKRDGSTDSADKYSARPGFSEHQTGLCTDINLIDDSFEKTDAFKWLDKNAYKYGFILRFPKDKEYITGYKYEAWHYRYVGKEAAKVIYDEGITFEEYYAYYIEKTN